MSKLQTIAVEPAVKRAIAARGNAGQSYNDVLKRLLDVKEQPPQEKKKQKNAEGLVVQADPSTLPTTTSWTSEQR